MLFNEVIKESSFTRAAQKLNITAAAVSKQVSILEKELGVELFKRRAQSFELTDVGSYYHGVCIAVLQRIDICESRIQNFNKIPQGKLSIICATQFGRLFIEPYLKEFLEKYENISMDVEFNERLPSFKSEDVDLTIGMSIPTQEDIIQRTINYSEYIFCISPKLLEGLDLKDIDDLASIPYITHSIRKPDNIIVLPNGKNLKLMPRISMNDSAAILNLIEKGMGFALLLEYVVREKLSSGKIVRIFSEYELKKPIYIHYEKRKYVSPKVRCFISFFKEKGVFII